MRLKICGCHITYKVSNECLNVCEQVEMVEEQKTYPLPFLAVQGINLQVNDKQLLFLPIFICFTSLLCHNYSLVDNLFIRSLIPSEVSVANTIPSNLKQSHIFSLTFNDLFHILY